VEKIGYQKALIYDNYDDYLLSVPLTDKTILEYLHNDCTGRGGQQYCDICLFAPHDDDLAKEIRFRDLERKR
jgi:hypothetical protein